MFAAFAGLCRSRLHGLCIVRSSIQISQPKGLSSKRLIKQLKTETNRQIIRTHKKIGKAMNKGRIPETATLQERLSALNDFEAALRMTPLPDHLQQTATQLGIAAALNHVAPSKPKQPSAKPSGQRLPYRRYTSVDGIAIYVGKKAEDNDELSTSSKHRANNEWWLHASGCPGSHVVLKCTDETPPPEALKDAALLAARHSKAARAKTVKVSLTRCRDVSKQAGSPAGQVVLKGKTKLISVNMQASTERLVRLENSCNS